MKITKSQLKELIKKELKSALNESLEDEPGWDFLKRDPAQAFRDHIAQFQDVKPKKARTGKEIAGELGYDDEPDVISQAAAGDIDILQAFKEILAMHGHDDKDLASELHKIADEIEQEEQ